MDESVGVGVIKSALINDSVSFPEGNGATSEHLPTARGIHPRIIKFSSHIHFLISTDRKLEFSFGATFIICNLIVRFVPVIMDIAYC